MTKKMGETAEYNLKVLLNNHGKLLNEDFVENNFDSYKGNNYREEVISMYGYLKDAGYNEFVDVYLPNDKDSIYEIKSSSQPKTDLIFKTKSEVIKLSIKKGREWVLESVSGYDNYMSFVFLLKDMNFMDLHDELLRAEESFKLASIPRYVKMTGENSKEAIYEKAIKKGGIIDQSELWEVLETLEHSQHSNLDDTTYQDIKDTYVDINKNLRNIVSRTPEKYVGLVHELATKQNRLGGYGSASHYCLIVGYMIVGIKM